MPAPDVTEEMKNDLLVLQMRRALDPKRFYKAPDRKGLPKYFQVCVQYQFICVKILLSVPPKKHRKLCFD